VLLSGMGVASGLKENPIKVQLFILHWTNNKSDNTSRTCFSAEGDVELRKVRCGRS